MTKDEKIRAMNKAWNKYARKRARAQQAFAAIDAVAWAEYETTIATLVNADTGASK